MPAAHDTHWSAVLTVGAGISRLLKRAEWPVTEAELQHCREEKHREEVKGKDGAEQEEELREAQSEVEEEEAKASSSPSTPRSAGCALIMHSVL